MHDGVGRTVANRQRRRRPDSAGLVVAQIDHLAGEVADRIIVPGRQFVLAAVPRPGVTPTGLADQKAECPVGNAIDPGGRGPFVVDEANHVLAAIARKAAKSAWKLEWFERESRRRLRLGCGTLRRFRAGPASRRFGRVADGFDLSRQGPANAERTTAAIARSSVRSSSAR